jgi:hypothetical protein
MRRKYTASSVMPSVEHAAKSVAEYAVQLESTGPSATSVMNRVKNVCSACVTLAGHRPARGSRPQHDGPIENYGRAHGVSGHSDAEEDRPD